MNKKVWINNLNINISFSEKSFIKLIPYSLNHAGKYYNEKKVYKILISKKIKKGKFLQFILLTAITGLSIIITFDILQTDWNAFFDNRKKTK